MEKNSKEYDELTVSNGPYDVLPEVCAWLRSWVKLAIAA